MSTDDIQVTIDAMPDNDSFLPRYLTVQLLEILANKQDTIMDEKNLALKHPDFVANFKSKKLFNALTYSIFWRENIQAVIEENPQLINETDAYNRAPITIAIANEDFILALDLLKKGALLMIEDKLVLEIALISMIQRDPKIISHIADDNTSVNLPWIKEYLEYLKSYIDGKPKKSRISTHEVLNPPLRHFGQVLDTLVYFNGLPSHYGFLSPSIQILSQHLEEFTHELPAESQILTAFKTVANAYVETATICNYNGNLPNNNESAQTLAKKIQNNLKTNNNKAVVLFGGWAGTSITMAFVNNILILSNLGAGGDPDAGTQIFTINNPDNITEKIVNNFICGLGNAIAPYPILDSLGDFVDNKPIFTLKQPFNPIDNCIFINPRAIIQGLILVLHAFESDRTVSFASLTALNNTVSSFYTAYLQSLYKYYTNDLTKQIRSSALLQNKRIECCAIALNYINQHYQDPASLKLCVELKNALEFVGLGDFYQNNISTEAKNAIQQLMIREQEVTAIKVIQQENQMLQQAKNA